MSLKEIMTEFVDNLITYDYILFATVFSLFVLFVILAIVLRRKTVLAVFLIILSFSILFLGPTLGYIAMHDILFKNSTKLVSQKRLSFTPAIVVNGTLRNESKLDFESCKITASVYKTSKNVIKKYIYPLKPLKKMSIVRENILKGESEEFKMIVEPFTYKKDYNISIEASCR